MKPYLSDSCSYLCYEQVNAVFVVFSNQFRLKNGFGVLQMLQQRNTEESKKDKRNDVSLFHNPLRRTKSRHHPFRGTLPWKRQWNHGFPYFWKHHKTIKRKKWLGYEFKQKQLLEDTVWKVVGILDTKANALSKDTRMSSFLISRIITSLLGTENRFNTIVVSPSYHISKIESLKQFKSILNNQDIECTYPWNKTSGFDACAVRTTELIFSFWIVPFVIFGLLVNLAPHIKRFIHKKKTDKFYRSIGL